MKTGNIFFGLFLVALAGYVIYTASQWSFKTGFFPLAVAVPLMVLALLHLLLDLFGRPEANAERAAEAEFSSVGSATDARRRALAMFAWIAGFIALVYLVSFPVAVPLFMFLYLKLQSQVSLLRSVVLTAITWIFYHALFERLINLRFESGWVQTTLGL
ncbi:MAG TPA: tripartite tricarboxylate transporter TctB family protein [Candidatus Binatia bacterium]|nr:tripartite tricarboxylate transporter TctB family protein [Candidatus Binatia bacterium]